MPIVFCRHIWSTVSNIIFVTLAALAALSLFQIAFFHVNMAFMVHPTQLVGVTVHVYALFTKLKQKSAKIECRGMYSTTSCCLFPTHLRVATLITTEQLQKIFFFLFVVNSRWVRLLSDLPSSTGETQAPAVTSFLRRPYTTSVWDSGSVQMLVMSLPQLLGPSVCSCRCVLPLVQQPQSSSS